MTVVLGVMAGYQSSIFCSTLNLRLGFGVGVIICMIS